MTATTVHAVYCDGCTPDEDGNCRVVTGYGDEESRRDAGEYTVTTTYVPDTAVYVRVDAVLYEVEHVDALIARLLEERDRIAKQEANGL